MRIDGKWHVCDDGVLRPVLFGELSVAGETWLPVPLLVDTGADRTVLTYLTFEALCDEGVRTARSSLGGLGGLAECACVDLQLRLNTTSNSLATFRGEFAATLEKKALDINVLGRDILSLFAAIVDYPKRSVCLLSQSHDYQIVS